MAHRCLLVDVPTCHQHTNNYNFKTSFYTKYRFFYAQFFKHLYVCNYYVKKPVIFIKYVTCCIGAKSKVIHNEFPLTAKKCEQNKKTDITHYKIIISVLCFHALITHKLL